MALNGMYEELQDEVNTLREQLTVTKAERDEQKSFHDQVSVQCANAMTEWNASIVELDKVRKELKETRDKLDFAKAAICKLADMATCYLTCEVDSTEELVEEIEALRNVGEMS